jgi:hypothetical protein
MDDCRFDSLTRRLAEGGWSRRRLSRRLAAGALALLIGEGAQAVSAKKKRKKKKKKKGNGSKILCRGDGGHCTKKSKRCTSKNCLKTPITIEARWSSSTQDHDAFLFVPNEPGTSDPFPFIAFTCLSSDTNNGTLYPFAFMSGDAQGPGDEIATIQQLLAGKYEYWTLVHGPAEAGDLTVILRNANGKVVGTWGSPPNPSATNELIGWHVFDIDGATHSVTVSNDVGIDPLDAHPDNTEVCPA